MAMTGTVKFFNAERGYGFIKPDDGGRDVFVHITAVERAGLKDLTEGQRITFEVEPDKKGKGPKDVWTYRVTEPLPELQLQLKIEVVFHF